MKKYPYHVKGGLDFSTWRRLHSYRLLKGYEGTGSHNRVIQDLLDKAQQEPPPVTVEEMFEILHYNRDQMALIADAVATGKTSLALLMHNGPLEAAKRVIALHERAEGLRAPSLPTTPGTAYARIDAYVARITAQNEAATTKAQRTFLSQSLIADDTGVRRPSLRAWWKIHGEEVSAHNRAMGFRTDHEGHLHNAVKARQKRLHQKPTTGMCGEKQKCTKVAQE